MTATFVLNPHMVLNKDEHFASVVLLAGMKGSSGGTTFTDDSLSAHTMTPSGNVNTITTNPPSFQTSSAFFDGVGDFITVADNANWHFGSGDFTVEGYIRSNGTITDALLAQWGADDRGWALFDDGDGNFEFFYSTTGADSNSSVYAHTDKRNIWLHVAYSRVGNTGYLCYDGVIRATKDMTGHTLFNSTRPLVFGANANGTSAEYAGQMAEWRVTKGVGRYSGSVNDAITLNPPFPRS